MALKINQTKEYKSLVWTLFWKAKAKEVCWTIGIILAIIFLPIIVFQLYWHITPQSFPFHQFCQTYIISDNALSGCETEYYPALSQIWFIVQWLGGLFGAVIVGFVLGITLAWISDNWDDAKAEAMVKIRAKRSNKRK